MKFSELVKGRQSDRKYLPKEVEKEKIIKCLEAADLGLGSCIMGWFDEKKDSPTRAKVRKPLEEISGWNRY